MVAKHRQNGRGERTRGGIVLLAWERNFPVNEPNIQIFTRIVILGELHGIPDVRIPLRIGPSQKLIVQE